MSSSPVPMQLEAPQATLPAPGADAPGPFVSGTVHKLFRLGQRLSAADLADDMESDDGPVTVGRKFGGTHTAARRQGLSGSGGPGAGTGVRGGASLWDLVEAGVIVPGRGKISVTYKGYTVSATLTDDGCIEHQGRKYQSATAFSIHFKRTITPSKQGDDGWKSVLYDGKPLEHYRHIHSTHLRQQMAAAVKTGEAQGGDAAAAGPSAAAAAPAPPLAAPQEATPAAAAAPAEQPAPEPAAQPAAEQAPVPVQEAAAAEAPKSRKRPASAAKAAPKTAQKTAPKSSGKKSTPAAQPSAAPKSAPRSGGGRSAKSKAAAAAAEAEAEEAAAPAAAAAAPLTIDGQLVVELGPGGGDGLTPSDQWVQCGRCQTWRLVPNEHWQAVQDDEREEWHCEDAQWPLTASHPFTPACKKGGKKR